MEATLLSFPSLKPSPCLLSFGQQSIPLLPSSLSKPRTHFSSTIRAAISRTEKEETVDTVKTHLKNCHLLAGIRYTGFTVKQFQDLRRSMPRYTKLLVAKNTLVLKAIEGTKWEQLKPCMRGMNAWLFVHIEEISTALKPYRNFQKEKKLDGNDFTSVVFSGKFYGPDEFKALVCGGGLVLAKCRYSGGGLQEADDKATQLSTEH